LLAKDSLAVSNDENTVVMIMLWESRCTLGGVKDSVSIVSENSVSGSDSCGDWAILES